MPLFLNVIKFQYVILQKPVNVKKNPTTVMKITLFKQKNKLLRYYEKFGICEEENV